MSGSVFSIIYECFISGLSQTFQYKNKNFSFSIGFFYAWKN